MYDFEHGQKDSNGEVIKKETAYIAIGTVVISAIVQIVWSLFFNYDISVFLGSLWGGIFAIGNFYLMGRTVMKAVEDGDEVLARKRLHSSYSLRLALMAVMVVVSFIFDKINWLMAVMSLLFPRITILAEPLFRKDLRRKGGKK